MSQYAKNRSCISCNVHVPEGRGQFLPHTLSELLPEERVLCGPCYHVPPDVITSKVHKIVADHKAKVVEETLQHGTRDILESAVMACDPADRAKLIDVWRSLRRVYTDSCKRVGEDSVDWLVELLNEGWTNQKLEAIETYINSEIERQTPKKTKEERMADDLQKVADHLANSVMNDSRPMRETVLSLIQELRRVEK